MIYFENMKVVIVFAGLISGVFAIANNMFVRYDIMERVRHNEVFTYAPLYGHSAAQCCYMCAQDIGCFSVTFNEITGSCSKSEDPDIISACSSGQNVCTADTDSTIYEMTGIIGQLSNCFGRSCYYISPDQQDLVTAEAYCASTGAHLVDMATADEIQFVRDFLDDSGYTVSDQFYTGGSYIAENDTFVWSDNTPVPDTETPPQIWAGGQPNPSVDGHFIKLGMVGQDWFWSNGKAHDINSYALCEDD